MHIIGTLAAVANQRLVFFPPSSSGRSVQLVSRLTAQLAADKVGEEGFDLQSGTPLSRPRRTCSSNNCDVCESEANLSIERAESQTRQKDAKEGEKEKPSLAAVIATQSIAKHLLSGRHPSLASIVLCLLTSCPPPIRDPLNTSPFRIFIHPTQLFN